MKSKLIILFLFSFINSATVLPSEEIWNKVKDYITFGKMLLQNKTHFIFDENNFTNLAVNDSKMQFLYKKQEELFNKNGIANYIFAVNYLNEQEEAIEKAADNLYNYISTYFNIDISNSVISLFSIKSKRVRIKLGTITQQNISDSNAASMINNLGDYLRNKEYYNAWIKLIDDIDDYYNYKTNWGLIIGIIAAVIIVVGLSIAIPIIFCKDKCDCEGSSSSGGGGGYYYGGACGGGGGCGGGGATGGW